MTKAFLFGKFLPFHKGHEAMINFALTQCDLLTILICCSDKETISDSVRLSWIKNTFPNQLKIEFKIFNYKESEFPNSSVSSREVSKIWATKFSTLFPDYSIVITSEPYGEYLAEFMGIQHLAFDLERKYVPVSATMIREDCWSTWPFLPDAVKPSYVKKIVLLGSESTGKTTLTKLLADHFHASSVLEAARDIIKDSKNFSLEDLYLVAREHSATIKKELAGNSPLIIIDTDIHITQSYANYFFGENLELPKEYYAINQADLYLYLNNDVPFIQDGTRLNEMERNAMDKAHRELLKKYGIIFQEITGNWGERYEKSLKLVENLFQNAKSVSHRID